MANIIGDDFSNKDGGSVEIYAENRRKPYVHDGMGTNCEWLMINEEANDQRRISYQENSA
jgi:hypothetical protein